MNIISKSIILFKASSEDSEVCPYLEILLRHGFSVHSLSPIIFEYYNLEIFYEKLINPEDYYGIIFTSPRAVFGTKLSLQNDSMPKGWQSLSNYVVGKSTQQHAFEMLSLDCKGSESGSASNLADFILNRNKQINKPFLFPCGNLKKNVLPEKFKENNVELNSVVLYETSKNPKLEDDFQKTTSNFTKIPEYIIYFSPSGVQKTVNLLNKFDTSKVKFISIGLTTAEELKSIGVVVSAVANNPTPEYLLSAILKVK